MNASGTLKLSVCPPHPVTIIIVIAEVHTNTMVAIVTVAMGALIRVANAVLVIISNVISIIKEEEAAAAAAEQVVLICIKDMSKIESPIHLGPSIGESPPSFTSLTSLCTNIVNKFV